MRALLALPVFCTAVLAGAAPGLPGPAAADPSGWRLDPPFGLQRGRIGVQVQSMTPELREHMGAPRGRGVLVVQVEDGGPAARAGVAVGDVIVEVDATAIESSWDLIRLVARAESDAELDLHIVRAGEARKLSVKPEGEPLRWTDPQHWEDWAERHMRRGSQELRRRLEELERRLEDLERRLEQPSQQTT